MTSLTFSSSVTQLAVDIPITNDLLTEIDEIFQVTLTTLDGDVNLNPATGFVTIIDDDRKPVDKHYIPPSIIHTLLKMRRSSSTAMCQ